MSDDRLTPILRQLDRPASPDPGFTNALFQSLTSRIEAARRADAAPWAPFRRWWRGSLVLDGLRSDRRAQWLTIVIVATLVVTLIAVVALGQRKPTPPLLSLTANGLLSIDAETGAKVDLRDVLDPMRPVGGGLASLGSSPDEATAAIVLQDAGAGGPVMNSPGVLLIGPGSRTVSFVGDPGDGTPAVSSTGLVAWMGEWQNADGSDAALPTVHVARLGDTTSRTWTVPDGSAVLSMAWSPDGRTLAVATISLCGPAQASRIYLLDGATGAATAVGDAEIAAQGVAWSPDGRRLASIVRRGGWCSDDASTDLVTIDVTTGALDVVMPSYGGVDPLWTPDDQWLVIAGDDTDGPSWVGKVRLDGSDKTSLTTAITTVIGGTALSPDGRSLAVVAMTPGADSSNGTYGGVDTLSIVSMDDGRVVASVDGIQGNALPSLAWSPDSAWIAFARTRIGPISDRTEIRDAIRPWVVRSDGTDLHRLFDEVSTAIGW